MTVITAIILFATTYVLLLALPKYRAHVCFCSAIVFSVWLAINNSVNLTFKDIWQAIDFNVLMMIAGTMGLVVLFIDSKMPMKIADFVVSKLKTAKAAIVAMAILAGLISAFVDNVATVLMLAPIALAICKQQNISPVAPIIAITISSNLQGAATLVGDTTSILLGSYTGMTFFDFFVYKGKLSLFFIVETGALLTVFILLFLFRKEKKPLKEQNKTVVNDYVPSILLVGTILSLILASFLKSPESGIWKTIYDLRNGFICLSFLLVGLLINAIRKKDFYMTKKVFKEIDYQTLLLLASLFIVIMGITKAGVITELSELLVNLGGGNVFLLYTLIVFASVLISAFVDNIPYVLTMLPVIQGVSVSLGISPYVLYFGLLVGSTLGGNITPIGASANITGNGILRKEGYEVKTKDFMKISVPFTLVAVLSGYLMTWLFWGI